MSKKMERMNEKFMKFLLFSIKIRKPVEKSTMVCYNSTGNPAQPVSIEMYYHN